MNFSLFLLIQNLVEKYQQYLSDIESDSESENEIEEIDINRHKQPQTKHDCLKKVKIDEEKLLKKRIYEFPNGSNFDDTG